MTVSITFNGTIIEDEGGLEAGTPEDNNVSSLPSGISFNPTADGVTLPSASASFPTFAQFNNLVTITGATGTPTALFSDANGVALSGADSGLTTDNNTKIYLYTSPTNPLIVYGIAQTSPGSISSGTLVFAIMMQTTTDASGNLNGGNFFIEQYQAIKNPLTGQVDDNDIVHLTAGSLFVSVRQDLIFNNFTQVPSGNELWVGIQPSSTTAPNAPDLLVTGIAPNPTSPSQGDEVDVSQTAANGSLGADGQQLKQGVGLRIDFVNGVLEPESQTTSKDPTALTYTSRQNGTGAGWSPVQTNPTKSLISAHMVAYEVTGTQTQTSYFQQINNNNPGGTPDGTQTQSVIHSVTVADDTGKVIGTATNRHTATSTTPEVDAITTGANGITVSFDSTGAATVNNITTNYLVTFSTETVMDGFTVTNVTSKSNVSFDIANIHALGVVSSSADASLHVNFEDAGPTITASAAGEPTLTTTDPVAPSTSTANGAFAGQFTANFAADGQAASNPTTYALSTSGGASGLTDTATKQAVNLSLDSSTGNIVGKDTSGDTVFTVSVNSSGMVTLTQFRAVVQGTGESPDIGETVGLTGTNLVVLSDTITDGDGDQATATLDLTPQLLFKDVGPSIVVNGNPEPTLTTTDTTAANPTSQSGNFAVDFTPNYNADGPAASNPETFALSTPGGASGLTDTLTGQSVVLSLVGGQVVGTAGAGGPTVFTVSVDGTGQVTLTQLRAVKQGVGENPDIGETVGLTGTNLVKLTATATDGDGDQATASLDLTPQLLFKDVGPTITVDNITNGTYAAGGNSTWAEAPNADGFQSLNVTLNNYTIDNHSQVTVNSSLGTDTITDANGNYVFNGTINDDFNGDGKSDTVTFKLTFNPNNDTYKIDVTTPPVTVINFDTSQGSLPAGGPHPVQALTLSSGPEAGTNIVFFGAVATAPQNDGVVDSTPNDIEDLVGLGQPDPTKAQIDALLGPPNKIPTLINSSTQMNVSTSGIGINNNNLDGSGAGIQNTDESFVVNPQLPVDKVTVFIDNSVGGYDPSTEDLEYSVYFIDGSVTAPKKVQAADLHPVTSGPASGGKSFDISDVAGGPQIDAVQLTMANGTVKIPVIQFAIQQTFNPQPLNMNLTATLTDGDADTSKHQFSIALA
jgi:hypothetical protein